MSLTALSIIHRPTYRSRIARDFQKFLEGLNLDPGVTEFVMKHCRQLTAAANQLSRYRPAESRPIKDYLAWYRANSGQTDLQLALGIVYFDAYAEMARRAGVESFNPWDRMWPERNAVLSEVIMQAFFEHLKQEGRSPKTIKWYADRAVVFRRYLAENGSQPTDIVDAPMILNFYDHLRAKGRTPSTLASYDRAFRSVFKFLLEAGSIPVNPMVKVGRLKAPRKLHDPFDRGEITRLLAGIYQHEASPLRERDIAILRLMYDTGMRSGALCSIRYPEDIDNQARAVNLITKYGKEPVLGYGVRAAQAIEAYLPLRPECPYLFVRDRRGVGPLTDGGIHEALKRWCKYAEVRYRKVHFLRSTAACEWYNSGMVPQQVQIALDHEDYSTTRIYTATAENLEVRRMMQDNAAGDRLEVPAAPGARV